jgi:glutathione S-transferase
VALAAPFAGYDALQPSETTNTVKATVKLYTVPLSPFAASCRLAVYAKGLEDRIELCSPPGQLKSPEYLAINPIGKIPSLQLDGWSLAESATICEYLEDRFPEPSLRSADLDTRARQRLLARIVDLYVYPPLLVLFRQPAAGVRDEHAIEKAFVDLDQALGFLSHWFATDETDLGESLTLADCALIPALFYVRTMGRAFGRDVFAKYTRIADYWQRVKQVPAASRVLGEMSEALAERQRRAS